jgi:hypothetical protein
VLEPALPAQLDPRCGPAFCREAFGSMRWATLRSSGFAAVSSETFGTRSLRSLASRRNSQRPCPATQEAGHSAADVTMVLLVWWGSS